mmetsp:Transcript_124364/g.277863  ORF Transcript_124364/g.277863 Transcript_124364/m.277863 type:complete len:730 (+) Transcript_124364:105-2294(+)
MGAGQPDDGRLPSLVKSPSAAAVVGPSVGASNAEVGLPRVNSQPGLNKSPGLVTVKFRGDHGLRWEGTRVSGSVLQAWMLGVRPGWTIEKVAGQAVQTSDDIEEFLYKAVGTEKRYEVSFMKGQANFGTEAKERADREKRNIAKLRKTFVFQGTIDRTEHRGITYKQLERVFNFAEESCHIWHDTFPAKFSKTSGLPLAMDFMNLHHINAWVIKPATKTKKCSFVELLTGQPQQPVFFVSHWWGEPIVHFMQCLQAHMTTRGLSDEVPYWVCAYANRQHQLQSEISSDPKKSSFYKALEVARFNVLLILDHEATPFSRIWCGFEQSMCLERPSSPLDVATFTGSKAELLLQGLSHEEELMELQSPGKGIKAKVAREANFPIEIVSHGMAAELHKGEASVDDDRFRVLNSLLGRELQSPPLAEHPIYEETNARLHALFAAALFLRLTVGEADPWNDEKAEKRCIAASKALVHDVWRKSLDMHLEGLDSESCALLAESFPPNLMDLTLRLQCATINDEDMQILANGLPKNLKSLSLDFTNCKNLTDVGVAALSNVLDLEGTEVSFKLAGTRVSKEVQDWYAAEALKREEQGQDGQSRDYAAALGVTLCRSPETCEGLQMRAVPAATAMAAILAADSEQCRAKAAFRAINRIGERAFAVLDDNGAQKAKEMEAEMKAREAERKAMSSKRGGAKRGSSNQPPGLPAPAADPAQPPPADDAAQHPPADGGDGGD